MHYLGDGPQDNARRSGGSGVQLSTHLQLNVSPRRVLWGGCGTQRDISSALGWFAAAGEQPPWSTVALGIRFRVDEMTTRYRLVSARVSALLDAQIVSSS